MSAGLALFGDCVGAGGQNRTGVNSVADRGGSFNFSQTNQQLTNT